MKITGLWAHHVSRKTVGCDSQMRNEEGGAYDRFSNGSFLIPIQLHFSFWHSVGSLVPIHAAIMWIRWEAWDNLGQFGTLWNMENPYVGDPYKDS